MFSNRTAGSLALVAGLRKFLVSALALSAVVSGIAGCLLFFYAVGAAFRGRLDVALGGGALSLGLLALVAGCVFLADIVRGVFATGDDWKKVERERARREAWEGWNR